MRLRHLQSAKPKKSLQLGECLGRGHGLMRDGVVDARYGPTS